VELNSTFRRLPAEDQFERWADQTEPGFKFAVTLARHVTSFGRIEGVDAAAQTISKLGDRLGPVRIKVLQARDDGFLRLLLDTLDPEMRWALDFRHLRRRNPPYSDEGLAAEAKRIEALLGQGLDVFAYFQHEDEPTAPRYAERLLELVSGRGGE